MGKVLSVATRKARRFNAENRAHRHLDKEKLQPAPKFPSNLSDYQRVLEENPNFAQLESKKNSALDDRLKQVYVTSTNHTVVNSSDDETKKSLPLNRKPAEDYEFGYFEPEQVKRGRATLRQVLTFIGNHNAEPQTWTSEKISAEYKLKPSVVDNVLKHFLTFEVYIPDKKSEDKVLLTQRMRQLWDNDKPKTLPPPNYESDETLDRLLKEHEENQKKKEKDKKNTNGNQRRIE